MFCFMATWPSGLVLFTGLRIKATVLGTVLRAWDFPTKDTRFRTPQLSFFCHFLLRLRRSRGHSYRCYDNLYETGSQNHQFWQDPHDLGECLASCQQVWKVHVQSGLWRWALWRWCGDLQVGISIDWLILHIGDSRNAASKYRKSVHCQKELDTGGVRIRVAF